MDDAGGRTWALAAGLVGGALGLLAARLAINPFSLTVAAYIACTLVVETRRRSLPEPVPWWVAHVVLIPWAVIVLLPWGYYRAQDSWFLLSASIDPDLPRTWVYNLVALAGMTLGTLLAMVRLARPASPVRFRRIDWGRCSVALGLMVGLFLFSFLIARRPLSALWRLGGDVRYFDNVDQATGLGVLDYATTVASGVLLVATAARRDRSAKPARAEVLWLLVLCVLALGTGARGRVYLLTLGWFVLQFKPTIADRFAAASHKIVVATAATLFALVMALGAVWISDLRSRGQGVPQGSVVGRAVANLDVVSSAELLMMRGAVPGMLHGESYRQLPSLAVPRRLAGESKSNPAADDVVRRLLDQAAGFSAPLWFESVLNYGGGGVFVFSILLGSVCVILLVKAHGMKAPLGTPVLALGPVWLLVAYLSMSRLTLLQFGLTTGSVVLGAFLAVRLGAVTADEQVPEAATTGSEG